MLDDMVIRRALARVGELLASHPRDVRILIVGGAAGLLTGELPGGARTTADVDAVHYDPAGDRDDVLLAAEQVGREQGLPPSWMSEDAGLHAWTLPDGWRERRVTVGVWGRLRVDAVGRADLIAMKFLAGRAGDYEHLLDLRVTEAERRFVVALLDVMPATRPADDQGKIARARRVAVEWECEP